MKTITEREAFCIAVPRRPAVLCLPHPDGGTDMIMTEWFNWLNMVRQPMISIAMNRGAGVVAELKEGREFYLAFPPVKAALKYKEGVRIPSGGAPSLPEGVEPGIASGIPAQVPMGSEVVLRCAVFNAYNYPFKKIRIFNCNLDKATALKGGDVRRLLRDKEDDGGEAEA